MTVIWILIGVLIGWLTKIPFMLRLYKDIKQRQAHMEQIVINFEKRRKNENK